MAYGLAKVCRLLPLLAFQPSHRPVREPTPRAVSRQVSASAFTSISVPPSVKASPVRAQRVACYLVLLDAPYPVCGGVDRSLPMLECQPMYPPMSRHLHYLECLQVC